MLTVFGVFVFLCRLQSLTQLTCSYEAENQTRYLVCDLGNPMKSGTSVRANKACMLSLAFFTFCVSVQFSQVKLFLRSITHTQTRFFFFVDLIKHTRYKSNFDVERKSPVSRIRVWACVHCEGSVSFWHLSKNCLSAFHYH